MLLAALRWPGVSTGLHMDDLAQRAMVEGTYPAPRAPWDLYTFASGDPAEVQTLVAAGALPWWSDPQLRLSALRPLASLTVWLDVVGWGPRGAHVHSLLWWMAMLLGLGWALRPLLGVRWAWLAVVLYGLDDAHTYPLAWLANRAPLISGTFGWLALGLVVRRDAARWPWVLGCAAACMAAGEYGLCALVYAGLAVLLLDSRPRRLRASMLGALAAPLFVYALLHRGFGARYSDVYLDPVADPSAYLVGALDRAPRLLTDMVTGAPLARFEAWSTAETWAVLAGACAVVAGLFLALHRESGSRRIAGWAALSAAVAVLPVCASFLSERLNVLAGLGAHIVLAGIVHAVLGRLWDATQRRAAFTWLAAASLLPIAWGHGWVPWRTASLKLDGLRRFNAAGSALVEAMPVDDARAADEHWVLLAVGDPMMLVYPPHLRAMGGHPRPGRFTVLCLAPGPLSMTRASERALDITAPWLQTPLERFFRSAQRPLGREAVAIGPGLRAQPVAWDGDAVRTVRFTFDQPLDGPGVRVMSVGLRGVFRYPLARVGATMPLAPGVDAVRAAGS